MAWRINTRMLRMMIAVADTSTLAAAAARLNITPSALSHQMRVTEATLRVRLFERVGRKVSLTPVGGQLLASSRIIVAEMDRAEDTLDRSRRSDSPSVRIGGGAYPVHRWFRAEPLSKEGWWRAMDFIMQASGGALARSVALGELDLGFSASVQQERGVLALPLFTDELVAVFGANHPLAARDFVEARDLAEETYVTYSRVIETGLEDDLFFKPARFAPAVIREAGSVTAVLDIVADHGGFSILSRWAVESHACGEALASRPLTRGGLTTTWHALLRGSDETNEELARIVRFVRQRFEQRAGKQSARNDELSSTRC